jgi:hypothetical protein
MAKKCRFRKKNGERCDADAQTGKTLCAFHHPSRANRDPQREGIEPRLAEDSPPALLESVAE